MRHLLEPVSGPSPRRVARAVSSVGVVLTVLGTASGCRDKKAPVAVWAHDRATWDMTKWKEACSPDAIPKEDATSLAWTRLRLDPRTNDERVEAVVSCAVSFDAGRPVSLSISVKALPEEIPALLERPVGAMLTEVPPAVAAVARELVATGRRGGKYVDAFAVATFFDDQDNALQQSIDGRWAAAFTVTITPRDAM